MPDDTPKPLRFYRSAVLTNPDTNQRMEERFFNDGTVEYWANMQFPILEGPKAGSVATVPIMLKGSTPEEAFQLFEESMDEQEDAVKETIFNQIEEEEKKRRNRIVVPRRR